MSKDDAIINPFKLPYLTNLGDIAVMISSKSDIFALCRVMEVDKDKYTNLMMSRLYIHNDKKLNISILGPMIGAPYAAILLETLIANEVKKIIFLGLCGAISTKIKIGDIIVPSSSFIDEGTSKHYVNTSTSYPSPIMIEKIKKSLKKINAGFHEGNIWTTDAFYRETPDKVKYFQAKDGLAVEMETSALFTISKFRDVDIGAILVVSDELSTYSWKKGFKDKRLKQGLSKTYEAITDLCKTLNSNNR